MAENKIMRMDLQIDIEHNKPNYFVVLPNDADKWKAALSESCHFNGCIAMNVQVVGQWCEIGFFHAEDVGELSRGNGFGFQVSKDTLIAMRKAIDLSLEMLSGEN
ncbi:MAG: hypothetical protein Q8P07_05160 [bacterium]|nr:hypothetical protein [bacterium]